MNNNEDLRPAVFLVDDDPAVRRALSRGLAAEGFAVHCWQTGDEFLDEHDPDVPGCLVSDVSMPGLNGLQLQKLLASGEFTRQIVFISGKGSIPMTVEAMRSGAVSFLSKPVRLEDLVAAVREALERDRAAREDRARRSNSRTRLLSLTSREREVLDLVVAGKLNKQIAATLGAAEKTIKVHRGRVMLKMQVRSVAELVRIVGDAQAA